MEQTMTQAGHELLHGREGVTYRGLLGSSNVQPTPPETMTRQQRRAAERAAAKAARNNAASQRTIIAREPL